LGQVVEAAWIPSQSFLEQDAMRTPIVQLQQFIRAIRDAGYRGTSYALAELVDNAFEARAESVDITLRQDPENSSAQVILVSDNGTGMSPAILKMALQFGGSSRFGQRNATGRFGMGLPNSSVSQARRLEVFTWTRPRAVWWSYLDVDEIHEGKLREIPEPVRRSVPDEYGLRQADSGTVIIWRKCDRLSLKRESALLRRLRRELGRIFRHMLWNGRSMRINGQTVLPVDPLLLRPGDNIQGALMYGEALEYQIKDDIGAGSAAGKITAHFVEFPVNKWISLSNAQKHESGISKNAGVSVLRAGREIDYGWFFMGSKRRENYDDWWRCEIDFPPQLDELFGVTHTKQGITPSEYITQLLAPDFEAIAHKLNARARSSFVKVRGKKSLCSERRASECDRLFTPPNGLEKAPRLRSKGINTPVDRSGLRYKLSTEAFTGPEFYLSKVNASELSVVLNTKHPFYERFYHQLGNGQYFAPAAIAETVELLLFAAARAEVGVENPSAQNTLAEFRRSWSDLVAAYLR